MDSPGQRRGSCGHKMAGFDMHEKCARCRDKGLGKDPCIMGGAICKICDNFTAIQREMLATPQYQIRKDKKAGLLVSPRDITVQLILLNSQLFLRMLSRRFPKMTVRMRKTSLGVAIM